MQIGFLHFIPYPVTKHTTVYTAMKNFIKILQQLDQKACLLIFCAESVYRIVVYIYLKLPNEFKKLVLCLGSFHMAKCVQHCIRKYI